MIVIETTFTHHAMTLEARVVYGLDLFRNLWGSFVKKLLTKAISLSSCA